MIKYFFLQFCFYHDSCKVDGCDTVKNDEYVVVCELCEAVVKSSWEQEGENLQVKVKRRPGRRLVLRHGRDDGDVVFGVAEFK